MNNTIFMTYKKNIPPIVFDRWKNLNKLYNIDFSLDNDCIFFLNKYLNKYIANLFKKIKIGMYKADLWRLCKLYINGGIYADVDLVPHINMNILDKDITFYSCLAIDKNSIFQAFIMNNSTPKDPLLLCFIVSFLQNNPYNYHNGPTFDMYNCISYNLNNIKLMPEIKYKLSTIRIPIIVGSSIKNNKEINLFYFPDDIEYTIQVKHHIYADTFNFKIKNNILYINRTDTNTGWGQKLIIDICIKANKSIYLFEEKSYNTSDIYTCYISYKGKNIIDSRDINYKNGW